MHTYVLGCPYSPRVQYNLISPNPYPSRINIPSTFQETPWANIHGDCVGYHVLQIDSYSRCQERMFVF